MDINSKEFKRGYENGLHTIEVLNKDKSLKERAQRAFDQAETDEDCDFKYGYQRAAIENGAIDPNC